MPSATLAYLPYSSPWLEKIDRLDWTAEQSFTAYGVRFGLRANDPAALDQVSAYLPLGWQPTPLAEVDVLYSLRLAHSTLPPSGVAGQAPPSQRQGTRHHHLLYFGPEPIARTLDLAHLYHNLEKHAQLLTAFLAQDCLFVHAGVVGWQGRAIVIPGRSMTGKTTLVRALIEAGAAYYSDEFTILDRQGFIHPYPVPLSIRGDNGQPTHRHPVEMLGGQVGVEPITVGLVVVTTYQAGARWRPRQLTASQALLALMDNTVAARRDPTHSMSILKQAVSGVVAFHSKRGEAGEVVADLLRRL